MSPAMLVPSLRFPEFDEKWNQVRIREILERASTPVAVDATKMYRQIGIRSHGKGIFHKEAVSGKRLGNKRVFWVEENAFVVNIVFAWEQAVAKTTPMEKGMIASHRFPMYLPKNGRANINFILEIFLTKKGKYLLGLASPGGAGRNKTLGQKIFEELKLVVPSQLEQQKIADFLTAVDKRISQLEEKKRRLTEYKKGVMQQIFSQQIRFTDDNGNPYPNWQEKRLGDVASFFSGGTPITTNKNFYDGDIPFIKSGEINSLKTKQYLSEAGVDGSSAKLVEVGDLLYALYGATSGEVGISKIKGAINQAVLCIRSQQNISYLYNFLRFNKVRILNKYLQGGQGNLSADIIKKLIIPFPSIQEQQKIANILTSIDTKIEQVSAQLKQAKTFKKGLLQKIFV